MPQPTLLIPVTFPDPDIHPISDVNVDTLDGFNIVLLGYWELPEGATAEEARAAHETAAEAVLYEIAAQFSHAGAATDIQLHFGAGGREKRELQRRILDETAPNGILIAKQLATLHNIFVPLRDNRHKENIVRFVAAFDTDNIFVVELYHAVTEAEAVEAAEEMLGTVEDSLLTQGFSGSDLELTVEVVDDPKTGIAAKARGHNIVVMGETEESDAENRMYSSVGEHVIHETVTPVIIVS